MKTESGPSPAVTVAIMVFLASLVLFSLMGLVIKELAPRYRADELSAYRNLFGMIPSALALWWSARWHEQGRPIIIRQWRLAILRGGIVIFAQFMFYLALARIAFATATTISYANALFMVAFAVPLLGEKVGVVRWSATMVGFAGVVMVMGVGSDGFTWDALLPLGAAAGYALTGILARMVDVDVPSPLLNLNSSVVAAIGAVIFVLFLGGFSPITTWGDLGWIVLMGSLGGTAVLLMVISFRMTEQSNLAPFSYFGIPLAFVMGWLFFNEAPWGDLIPGSFLIIFDGLLIIWRERRLKSAR